MVEQLLGLPDQDLAMVPVAVEVLVVLVLVQVVIQELLVVLHKDSHNSLIH
jgi:hypothetical protein